MDRLIGPFIGGMHELGRGVDEPDDVGLAAHLAWVMDPIRDSARRTACVRL